MVHPPGTGPAVGHAGAAGLRVAHVRPLRQEKLSTYQKKWMSPIALPIALS